MLTVSVYGIIMFKQTVWYQKGHKAEGIELLPQTRILQSLYLYIYIYS